VKLADLASLFRGYVGVFCKYRSASNGIDDPLELFSGVPDIVGVCNVQQVRCGDIPGFSMNLHLVHARPFAHGEIVRETVVVGRSQLP
jgi:hypothetical protein